MEGFRKHFSTMICFCLHPAQICLTLFQFDKGWLCQCTVELRLWCSKQRNTIMAWLKAKVKQRNTIKGQFGSKGFCAEPCRPLLPHRSTKPTSGEKGEFRLELKLIRYLDFIQNIGYSDFTSFQICCVHAKRGDMLRIPV